MLSARLQYNANSHHTVQIFKLLCLWNMKQVLVFFSYSCAISDKNYDFYYVFIRNFVQIWFRIVTKMSWNFVQKKSFRAKTRNFWARESTVSWKPLITIWQFQYFSSIQFRFNIKSFIYILFYSITGFRVLLTNKYGM